jgi:thiamine-monophosphate kinase
MPEGDGEFDIIERLFRPLAGEGALNLEDDAAVVASPEGMDTVMAKDAMVEGIHFLPDMAPDRVARKLLRTNLSDIAAMGGVPTSYLLALFRGPHTDAEWLRGFAEGLRLDQEHFGVKLLGGDSVSSPDRAAFSLTIIGTIGRGQAIRRNGAKPGDRVLVTGTIGDAGAGLAILQDRIKPASAGTERFLVDRHELPEPRVGVGPRLIGTATSAIDVSDGLLADLGHIATASSVRIDIHSENIPLSEAFLTTGFATLDAVTSGDDYELAFTAPADLAEKLSDLSRSTGVEITEIGVIAEGEGVRLLDRDGNEIACDKPGWRHY